MNQYDIENEKSLEIEKLYPELQIIEIEDTKQKKLNKKKEIAIINQVLNNNIL